MAKDLFHHAVKNAPIKDGWQITDDPLFLKVGGVELYMNLVVEDWTSHSFYSKSNLLLIK